MRKINLIPVCAELGNMASQYRENYKQSMKYKGKPNRLLIKAHGFYNLLVLKSEIYDLEYWSLKKRIVFSYIISWLYGTIVTYSNFGNFVWLILNVHLLFSMQIFFAVVLPKIQDRMKLRKYREQLEKEE